MEQESSPERQWFSIGKLVRDGVVDNYEREGCTVVMRRLSDDEFPEALRLKFQEEFQELFEAEPANKLTELADVYCVVKAYTRTGARDANIFLDHLVQSFARYSFSLNQVEDERQKRANEVGEFTRRLHVIAIEAPINSTWYPYLEKKYSKLAGVSFSSLI